MRYPKRREKAASIQNMPARDADKNLNTNTYPGPSMMCFCHLITNNLDDE